MEKKSNMYNLSVEQWSPFAGCEHECVYCKNSFQRQLKRWAKGQGDCPECAKFEPHYKKHLPRLEQKLPKTKHMQFIFTCSSGDIAFCPTEYLKEIIARIQSEPNKTFFNKKKVPQTLKKVHLPKKLLHCKKFETQREEMCEGNY